MRKKTGFDPIAFLLPRKNHILHIEYEKTVVQKIHIVADVIYLT